MSDYIPFDVQAKIMNRLPVKSLIQFRSVSRQWKSHIDSSKFISAYHLTQPQHRLFLSYIDSENCSSKSYTTISIVDDDSFPKQRFSLTVPLSVKLVNQPTVSSQGLLCFYETKKAVIWNPTIRRSVVVHVPNVLGSPYETILGFGVCPRTCDPTLVKLTFDRSLGDDTRVDVFTLSTKTWKTLANSLLRKSMAFTNNQVVIDRFIYWRAFDTANVDKGFGGCYVILSFDMITEEFKELNLRATLQVDITSCMSISELRESLAVVLTETVDKKEVISVWMMENGGKQLFTKKFTINMPHEVNEVLGFRMSGEPIIEWLNDHIVREDLLVYEPCSEQINCFWTILIENSCHVSSYLESLLLLDHSDDMN